MSLLILRTLRKNMSMCGHNDNFVSCCFFNGNHIKRPLTIGFNIICRDKKVTRPKFNGPVQVRTDLPLKLNTSPIAKLLNLTEEKRLILQTSLTPSNNYSNIFQKVFSYFLIFYSFYLSILPFIRLFE